ncbi:hypothetical protein NG799_02330 [Laspinema sp. D1]|uniref:Uncharacterized protein n=1 Tax=Laspinema palackyanum D2a TaxID=2953684 RepID=A0ABT2MKA0_9CYAN|nr:hypothetical protein [Laspinema sp. D2a]
MKLWPLWIPYPISILRAAFVLGIFMAIAFPFVSTLSLDFVQISTQEDLEEFAIAAILATWFCFLALIPLIAYAHHWGKGFLEEEWRRRFPFFPGIESWWEGLCAPFVLSLGCSLGLGMYLVLDDFFPSHWDEFAIASGFIIGAMAYLYQLGILFKEWKDYRKKLKAERRAAKQKARAEAQAAREKAEREAQEARKKKKAQAQAAREAKLKKSKD